MAAKRRHWKEKDGRYWARLAIPEQLRPLLDNKTQLTEPLGGDLKVADRNHAAAVARLEARLEAARGSMTAMKAHVAREAELRPLDPKERDKAAWDRYSTLLAEIEKKRATMPTASEIRSAYEETMQRIEAGEAGADRPISSRYNLYADYEIKAGARHFDATLRQRRLAALRSALPALGRKPDHAAGSAELAGFTPDVRPFGQDRRRQAPRCGAGGSDVGLRQRPPPDQ